MTQIKKHTLALVLLIGASGSSRPTRRQAFTFQNMPPPFRQVCAVPSAAVRCAGLPLGAHHLVGASAKHAFAVFRAEALAVRGGGAARHGARLFSAAVFVA